MHFAPHVQMHVSKKFTAARGGSEREDGGTEALDSIGQEMEEGSWSDYSKTQTVCVCMCVWERERERERDRERERERISEWESVWVSEKEREREKKEKGGKPWNLIQKEACVTPMMHCDKCLPAKDEWAPPCYLHQLQLGGIHNTTLWACLMTMVEERKLVCVEKKGKKAWEKERETGGGRDWNKKEKKWSWKHFLSVPDGRTSSPPW